MSAGLVLPSRNLGVSKGHWVEDSDRTSTDTECSSGYEADLHSSMFEFSYGNRMVKSKPDTTIKIKPKKKSTSPDTMSLPAIKTLDIRPLQPHESPFSNKDPSVSDRSSTPLTSEGELEFQLKSMNPPHSLRHLEEVTRKIDSGEYTLEDNPYIDELHRLITKTARNGTLNKRVLSKVLVARYDNMHTLRRRIVMERRKYENAMAEIEELRGELYFLSGTYAVPGIQIYQRLQVLERQNEILKREKADLLRRMKGLRKFRVEPTSIGPRGSGLN